jgi:predicted transcriptional regulator
MKCPEFDCANVVPEFPSESLRMQLKELEKMKLLGTEGALYILSALVCLEIK